MGYNPNDDKHRRQTSKPSSRLCFPTWMLQSKKQALTNEEVGARIELYAKRAELNLPLFDDSEKTE